MTTARSLYEIAVELRRVADQLDTAPDTEIPETDVRVQLQVVNYIRSAPDADRVAAVNAIAAAVGTVPDTDPEDRHGSAHHRSCAWDIDNTVLAYTAIRKH